MLAEEKIESAKFTTASGQKAQALCFFVHPRILALMSSSEEAAGSGDQNGTGICVLIRDCIWAKMWTFKELLG